MRQTFGYRALMICLAATLLASPGSGALALTTPVIPAAAATAEQQVSVRVIQPQPSVSTTGTLQADVLTTLTADAEYFEVRLRLKNPDGRLLYQKTEVRQNVKAGKQVIRFTRELKDLSSKAGRYPIEVRVLATGSQPTDIESRLFVLDKVPAAVPVAIVVRLTCSPVVDPAGRFLSDPSDVPGARANVELLADAVANDPNLRISLSIAPLLVEEWARARDGYETSGPEGIQQLSATSPGAISSAAALDRLKEMLVDERTELLDTPYAEPDLAGLATIGGLGDLAGQWALTDSLMKSALASEVSSGAAFLGDAVSTDALPELERRGTSFTVLKPLAVRAGDASATSGVYALDGSEVLGLVYDPQPAKAAAENDSDAFYDALFDRALAATPGQPLILKFEIGPRTQDSIASFKQAMQWLQTLPWVDIVSTTEAVEASTPKDGQLEDHLTPQGAPPGYWNEVSSARLKAIAASTMLGAKDTDARTAMNAAYIAESLCWAGPDRSWALSDRGRAFAASASRYVDDLFSSVKIAAQDVTLSNRTGQVPVSIVNGTGKPIKLTLSATAGLIAVQEKPRTISLDAGENVVTIPIDMGSQLADTMNIRLIAGDVTVAESTVGVHASYLDRLATLGMVFLFLAGLLWFIRRRVRNAGAGSMQEDSTDA